MESIWCLFRDPKIHRFDSLEQFMKQEKIEFQRHESLVIDNVSDQFIASQEWARTAGGLTTVEKIAAYFDKIMRCDPDNPAAEGLLSFQEGKWCYSVTLLQYCTITLLQATVPPVAKPSPAVLRLTEGGKGSPSSLRRAKNLSLDIGRVDIAPPASSARASPSRRSPDVHTNMMTLVGSGRSIDHKTITGRLDKGELLFLDEGKSVTIDHPQLYAWLEAYKEKEADLKITDASNSLWNAPNFLLSCLMFFAHKKCAMISGGFFWKVNESANLLEITALSGGATIRCSDSPPSKSFLELTEKLSS